MGKQAFLILAHNEYEVLQELASALDCPENDIYVHIDKKTPQLPELKAEYSNVFILEDRIKVYWGCLSVVEAETLLLERAYLSGHNYEYYHLISGIHYPLKPISEINAFYESKKHYSLVQTMMERQDSVDKRLGRYHFLLNNYYSPNRLKRSLFKLYWRITIKLQEKCGIKRDVSYFSGKSSNWCSLTNDAVKAWLSDKEKIQKRFRWTYCSDEYVAMSVLKDHNLPVEHCGNLLLQEFENGNPKVYKVSDYDALMKSKCLFGRKFTKESLDLIEQLKNENHKDLRN